MKYISKKSKPNIIEKYDNIIGWYGALATLSAYFMISFGLVDAKDLRYQLLNLTGAIGLGIICYFKKTYQPLFVNAVWAAIAILSLINIFLFIK